MSGKLKTNLNKVNSEPAVSIESIFTDPHFRSSSAKGYPNRLYGYGDKVGAVVAVRGQRGNDFALNADGLAYVVQAETEGRVKEGYVVLAKQNGGTTPEFIGAARASEVHERLLNVTPINGKWGPYHWITETFEPVTRDDGVPF